MYFVGDLTERFQAGCRPFRSKPISMTLGSAQLTVRTVTALVLLLALCGDIVTARSPDKVQRQHTSLDAFQHAGPSEYKNSVDTAENSQGGFGSAGCAPGETASHPLHRCKYLFCEKTGLYHTRSCPLGIDYDLETKRCSKEEPLCADVTHHVFRLNGRSKRSLDGAEGDADENKVAESVDISNDAPANLTELDKPSTKVVPPLDNTKIVEKEDAALTTPVLIAKEVSINVQPTTKAAVAMATNATDAPTTADQTTVAEQTTASTTSVKLTTLEVIIPGDPDTPPYVVVTQPPSDITTAKNISEPAEIVKSSNTGAIIGIIVAIVLIAAIITVIVVLVKKKKIKLASAKIPVKRKKKIVTRMENPQYGPSQTYRFSTDSALQVGPTSTTLTKFNNPNLADTPVPKVLQAESPGRQRQGSLPRSIASRRDKRKAPAPPNPFGNYDNDEEGDLYEKASHGSMELQTFTVKNENATEADDNDNEPSYPLLKKKDKDTDKSSSLENGKVKKEPEVTPENSAAADESLLPTADKRKSAASGDQVSADFTLDEYDLTNNPFFAKT